MKKLIIAIVILFGLTSIAQETLNVSANSTNGLIYSVGNLFVNPSNIDEANSGVIGAVSYTQFYVLGNQDIIIAHDIRFFPNPTNDILFFVSDEKFNKIYIFDLNGKLVLSKTIQKNNRIDLTILPNGVYTMKTDNHKIKFFKIIKK